MIFNSPKHWNKHTTGQNVPKKSIEAANRCSSTDLRPSMVTKIGPANVRRHVLCTRVQGMGKHAKPPCLSVPHRFLRNQRKSSTIKSIVESEASASTHQTLTRRASQRGVDQTSQKPFKAKFLYSKRFFSHREGKQAKPKHPWLYQKLCSSIRSGLARFPVCAQTKHFQKKPAEPCFQFRNQKP
jgi:hypothetical protein